MPPPDLDHMFLLVPVKEGQEGEEDFTKNQKIKTVKLLRNKNMTQLDHDGFLKMTEQEDLTN